MKTPKEQIEAVVKELKAEMKYCDKSVDIRIVQSALNKIMKALKANANERKFDGDNRGK